MQCVCPSHFIFVILVRLAHSCVVSFIFLLRSIFVLFCSVFFGVCFVSLLSLFHFIIVVCCPVVFLPGHFDWYAVVLYCNFVFETFIFWAAHSLHIYNHLQCWNGSFEDCTVDFCWFSSSFPSIYCNDHSIYFIEHRQEKNFDTDLNCTKKTSVGSHMPAYNQPQYTIAIYAWTISPQFTGAFPLTFFRIFRLEKSFPIHSVCWVDLLKRHRVNTSTSSVR